MIKELIMGIKEMIKEFIMSLLWDHRPIMGINEMIARPLGINEMIAKLVNAVSV